MNERRDYEFEKHKKTLLRNLMNKFRFVNELSSKFKNVNALIVVNIMIDFNSL